LPITEYDHTEILIDVRTSAKATSIVAPFQKSIRELRSLSNGTVGPLPMQISREVGCLQLNHFAYNYRHVQPETKISEYAMLSAALNYIAVFADGSYTPNAYKDLLKQKEIPGWWKSMKKEIIQRNRWVMADYFYF
jgi:hypothetical protein